MSSFLGIAVYLWDESSQDLLMTRAIAPALDEHPNVAGGEPLFWFVRSDIRGPHIFALVEVEEASHAATERLWSKHLEHFLDEHPSTVQLADEELQERHLANRGFAGCAADRRPGLAENNSFLLFEHSRDDYPFPFSAGLANEARLWELTSEISRWTLEQLRPEPKNAAHIAGRWIAEVSLALEELASEPFLYWHYHLKTLLPKAPIEADSTAPGLESRLCSVLGEKNVRSLEQVWGNVQADPGRTGSATSELLSLLTAQTGTRAKAFLRETIHTVLKQVGLQVRDQIPLILFSLLRGIKEREA